MNNDKLPRVKLSPEHADKLRQVIKKCNHLCATVTGPGIEMGLPLQAGHAEAQRQATLAANLLKLCDCPVESPIEGL